MFAVEVPPIELRYHELRAPVPAPVPALETVDEPEPARRSRCGGGAETVPVPPAPADAWPASARSEAPPPAGVLGMLVALDDDGSRPRLDGVPGGVAARARDPQACGVLAELDPTRLQLAQDGHAVHPTSAPSAA
jgi:hypothetical protein